MSTNKKNNKIKLIKITVLLAVSMILISGCITKQEGPKKPAVENVSPNWIKEGAIYETHPYYYVDGTFKSMTEKIPSIADLGVKTIYLMPIWEHVPAPNGEMKYGYIYSIYDYYNISSEFGTKDDLKELVATVHKYNMKIVFDLVTCCTPRKSIIYNNDWTFRVPLSELNNKGLDLKATTRNNNNIVASECVTGKNEYSMCKLSGTASGSDVILDNYPISNFGPAVDRTNPEVVDYFTKMTEYYVKEYDIDGWRVDTSANNWNPEIVSGDHSITKLLKSVKDAITKVKPDAIIMPENPSIKLDEIAQISYEPYKLKDTIYERIENDSMTSKQFINLLQQQKIGYNRTRAYFVETHDSGRINEMAPQLDKPLLVLISTVPGVPMIQAGQEIGATNKFRSHTPVDWTNGDYELNNFYKKVFKIRNNNSALKYGSIENVFKAGENTYAYLRSYESNKVIVVINFDDKPVSSTLDLPLKSGTVLHDKLNDESFTVNKPNNFKITLPAYGARILV